MGKSRCEAYINNSRLSQRGAQKLRPVAGLGGRGCLFSLRVNGAPCLTLPHHLFVCAASGPMWQRASEERSELYINHRRLIQQGGQKPWMPQPISGYMGDGRIRSEAAGPEPLRAQRD